MALFCTTIRRESLLRFPSLSHVQVFSLVCRLKNPYSCFFSHFCFLVNFVLLIHAFSVLSQVAVIGLPARLFMQSSSRYIVASTLSSMLVSPRPSSFLDTYSLSMSSLGCKALCIVMSFLVPWFKFFPHQL